MSDLFYLTQEQFDHIKKYLPYPHGNPRVDDLRWACWACAQCGRRGAGRIDRQFLSHDTGCLGTFARVGPDTLEAWAQAWVEDCVAMRDPYSRERGGRVVE